jgi:hypothetical protein
VNFRRLAAPCLPYKRTYITGTATVDAPAYASTGVQDKRAQTGGWLLDAEDDSLRHLQQP